MHFLMKSSNRFIFNVCFCMPFKDERLRLGYLQPDLSEIRLIM